jgi:hypothetical protein
MPTYLEPCALHPCTAAPCPALFTCPSRLNSRLCYFSRPFSVLCPDFGNPSDIPTRISKRSCWPSIGGSSSYQNFYRGSPTRTVFRLGNLYRGQTVSRRINSGIFKVDNDNVSTEWAPLSTNHKSSRRVAVPAGDI